MKEVIHIFLLSFYSLLIFLLVSGVEGRRVNSCLRLIKASGEDYHAPCTSAFNATLATSRQTKLQLGDFVQVYIFSRMKYQSGAQLHFQEQIRFPSRPNDAIDVSQDQTYHCTQNVKRTV